MKQKILKPLIDNCSRICVVEIIAPQILYLLRFHWIFYCFLKVLIMSKLDAVLDPLWSNKVQ